MWRNRGLRPSSRTFVPSPSLFFLAVFSWTWCFWLSAAGLGISAQSNLGKALLVGGLFGPTIAGIAFTYVSGGTERGREFWSRVLDPSRIAAKWLITIVFFVPCLMGVAVLLDVVLNGSTILARMGERVVPFLFAPLSFLLHVVIYGPILEELGWRGYVLDRLQANWSALSSSLILGALWALWHLPLFYIKEMNPHYFQGALSAWFWSFMARVIFISIIYTWIFNNTSRSTLAATIFHIMSNLTIGLTNATAGTNLYSTVLWLLAAVTVVSVSGAGTLTGSDNVQTCSRSEGRGGSGQPRTPHQRL
jgi:CAAX protease family protein